MSPLVGAGPNWLAVAGGRWSHHLRSLAIACPIILILILTPASPADANITFRIQNADDTSYLPILDLLSVICYLLSGTNELLLDILTIASDASRRRPVVEGDPQTTDRTAIGGDRSNNRAEGQLGQEDRRTGDLFL